jgi:two-component system sensor histidine kinase YesM
LPVVIIGVFSYVYFSEVIIEQTEINMRRMLDNISDSIEFKASIIERMSNQIFSDIELQKLLNGRHGAEESYINIKDNIMPKLRNTANLTVDDIRLEVYYYNKTLPEIYYIDQNNPLDRGTTVNLYYMERLLDKNWYNDLFIANNEYLWMQVESDKEYNNISLLRNIINFRDQSQIGFIRIITDLEKLFQEIYLEQLGANNFLAAVTNDGQIVYSNKNENNLSNLPDDMDNYLKIEENLEGMDLNLIAFISLDNLEKKANRVRDLTFIISLISLVVLTFLSIFISRYFSRNITNIVSSIDKFRDGDFTERIDYTGDDEFNHIVSAFNEMADRIEELIDEVLVNKLQQKESELELIQSQVNPHFLYNTLSLISQLGKLGKIDKMHQMVLELSKFYRLSLNKGEMLITIGQEIEHIKSYINILNIKYEDRLVINFKIDKSIYEFKTVKFILQPFIENSLEHAWYKGKMEIDLIGYQDESRIIFKIIDNGIGMKKEKVDQLLNNDEEKLGYGIFNVDQRIKLYFGEEYGVHISSQENSGTVIKIILPKYE